MINCIKDFFNPAKKSSEENDFSAFFSKSSGEKAKVIRAVLRRANEQQRKIARQYAGE